MSNEPDKVNSGALAAILVIVALATWAVALVVTSLVRDETARLHADGDVSQERAFRQLRAEQETKLNAAAAWVDKEAGLAKIPGRSAEQLVIEAIRANPLALSPGNPPEEEEEDAEEPAEGDESAKEDSETGDAAKADAAEGDVAEAPEADQKKPAPVVAPAPKVAPAPPKSAPVVPAAPKLVAPVAPVAPKPAPAPAPTPTPGGPTQ